MQMLRTKKGQSMAEYAILFAIVIGAAIAMQQYIKSRLQGATKGFSDNYLAAVAGGGGFAPVPFEPVRTVDTTSTQTDALLMVGASTGTRTLASTQKSDSTVTK
jgi:hypothetical protein